MPEHLRTYYCNKKFTFLKIDMPSQTIYNCDAAKPHRVDLDWLTQNPGQIFNTDTSIQDRKMMLSNIRNPNCEQNCWPAEDKGSISPRLHRKGYIQSHNDCYIQPEIIDMTVNKDCNLSCSYCCKEFSSRWQRDIIDNGDYKITDSDDRYTAVDKDFVIANISQPDLKKNQGYQLLLNEVKLAAPGLKKIFVSGGEPLLDNQLIETLSDMPFNPNIEFNLFSGLGLHMSRFQRLLEKLRILSDKYANFRMKISVESANTFYEFNRYGNTWNDFVEKINLLRDHKVSFIFHSTLSNLTLFDFANFRRSYSDIDYTIDYAHQPRMLAPHVLDPASKENIIEQIQNLNEKFTQNIIKSIRPDPSLKEKQNCREFLLEFTRRRPDLNLNIFPKSFLDWLEINRVV